MKSKADSINKKACLTAWELKKCFQVLQAREGFLEGERSSKSSLIIMT